GVGRFTVPRSSLWPLTRHNPRAYPVCGSWRRATAIRMGRSHIWRNDMEPTAASAPSLSQGGGTPTQGATARPLISKSLAGDPARELLMIAVEYPPGSVDPAHTHHAQSLVYVLEGSVVMQVRGGTPVTLAAGETFYEGPDDVHTVGRN